MNTLLIVTQKVDKNDQLLGFFIDWISGFAQKFRQITILCLERGKFNLPENVKVISLGKDGGVPKLFWLLNFYAYLFRHGSQYDAVFVHMNPIWVVLGSWWWLLTGKKVCLWYAHKSITTKLKLAEKFSDIIFTSTSDGFRLKSKKVNIVGQGINTDLFRPGLARPSAGTIISVGRIAPVKNYKPLLEAIKILKNSGVISKLTIVGEPTLAIDFKYQDNLKKIIKDMGLEESVKFVGKIINSDLPDYYRKNKVYVNLSNTGSLDKTILEAMASGCVVLSSNDSAKKFLPPNLVIRSENPNGIAEQIKEAMQFNVSSELRDYVVRNHSLPQLIQSMSELIKQP